MSTTPTEPAALLDAGIVILPIILWGIRVDVQTRDSLMRDAATMYDLGLARSGFCAIINHHRGD